MSLSYGFCLDTEDTLYDSAQFSEAIRALAGDGVCDYGSGFALTLGSGFNVSLGTGFVLVNGRWLESDERYPMTLPPSGNNADRYDAIAARADYEAKTVTLQVLVGVDPEALRQDMSPLRNEREYCVLLYLFHIRRGATSLRETDIEDVREDPVLCGRVVPVRQIAAKVLEVYAFLSGGIDAEVARILGLADAAIGRGTAAVEALDAAIRRKTGNAVGDVLTSLQRPSPAAEWLLCDGRLVPPEYGALVEAVGPVLPDIRHEDARFHSFIYGGVPGEAEQPGGEDSGVVGYAVVGTAIVGKDVT